MSRRNDEHIQKIRKEKYIARFSTETVKDEKNILIKVFVFYTRIAFTLSHFKNCLNIFSEYAAIFQNVFQNTILLKG